VRASAVSANSCTNPPGSRGPWGFPSASCTAPATSPVVTRRASTTAALPGGKRQSCQSRLPLPFALPRQRRLISLKGRWGGATARSRQRRGPAPEERRELLHRQQRRRALAEAVVRDLAHVRMRWALRSPVVPVFADLRLSDVAPADGATVRAGNWDRLRPHVLAGDGGSRSQLHANEQASGSMSARTYRAPGSCAQAGRRAAVSRWGSPRSPRRRGPEGRRDR
jgi:hypothetical protein